MGSLHGPHSIPIKFIIALPPRTPPPYLMIIFTISIDFICKFSRMLEVPFFNCFQNTVVDFGKIVIGAPTPATAPNANPEIRISSYPLKHFQNSPLFNVKHSPISMRLLCVNFVPTKLGITFLPSVRKVATGKNTPVIDGIL